MGRVRETPGGKGGVRDTGWLRVARACWAEENESRDSEKRAETMRKREREQRQ